MTVETPPVQQPVDKSGERVRRMFGEISSRYDLMNHVLSGGVDYYWRWRTVRLVPPRGTDPILDVCTGTGDLALTYWKRAGKKTPVIGSDFTHEMLVIAREKRERVVRGSDSAAGVEFLEADTQQLPFADDTFQIVSVAFGLRNVCDTRAGLREMLRVCRPGGRVAVLEFSTPTLPLIRGFYLWYFKNILPLIGQMFARNQQSAYNYLPQSVSEFPQGKVLAGIMEECGLQKVRWKPLTFGIATLYWGEK
ncbi:MAG: bifunctional demethylmenaquinone methyltransferase/2-methoxy-6-polyprenyl-1,4-benzoquinol methylase UbiE [Planctomycetales bacterium]